MAHCIRKTYRFHAPLYRVWRYFQDGVGLTSWFSERGTPLEPWVGGRIVIYFAGIGEIASGRVLAYVPGKTFAFRWSNSPLEGKEQLSDVTFEFSEAVDSTGKTLTTVKLIDEGIPDSPIWNEYYAGTHSGWSYYLMNLKSVVETGYDLRDLQMEC